jgi:hypothetical protein
MLTVCGYRGSRGEWLCLLRVVADKARDQIARVGGNCRSRGSQISRQVCTSRRDGIIAGVVQW